MKNLFARLKRAFFLQRAERRYQKQIGRVSDTHKFDAAILEPDEPDTVLADNGEPMQTLDHGALEMPSRRVTAFKSDLYDVMHGLEVYDHVGIFH